AKVDENWCIGCGVCTAKCEFDAVNIIYREDQKKIPANFETLHKKIIGQTNLIGK
ncbi:MAG: 4Fe-4S binding protein, partial [Desulfobacula sp.]|nr:4Fe-4S binding protein [Desulfobacula sp.]